VIGLAADVLCGVLGAWKYNHKIGFVAKFNFSDKHNKNFFFQLFCFTFHLRNTKQKAQQKRLLLLPKKG